MTIGDYDGLYHLWIHSHGMGINAEDDTRESIGKYLRRNPDTCFVAEKDGEIVGAIMSGHDGRRGFIHHTTVKISERKQGIGSALVGRAMAALKEEGINKVALLVYCVNETGNAFWEKQGFTVREDLVYRNKYIKQLHYLEP